MKFTRTDVQACSDCPIRHRAVCANCSDDELERLEEIKFYRTYVAGQPVLWAREEMSFVASVVTGVARLSLMLEDGRTQMVGLLLPSDFIGRPGRSRVRYDVTAATDLTICCFRRKPFEEILRTTPSVGVRLLQMTLDELDAAREWMMILGRKTAREKIASLIAQLARREADLGQAAAAGAVQLHLPLTREGIAEYLGMTLETVSRQMSALRRDGLIQMEGPRHLQIPDMAALRAETGDDQELY